jgi:hypothetical protein
MHPAFGKTSMVWTHESMGLPNTLLFGLVYLQVKNTVFLKVARECNDINGLDLEKFPIFF